MEKSIDLYDGYIILPYFKIKIRREVIYVKVKVYLKNGSSQIVDLGEVPDTIKRDQQAMFEHMLHIVVSQGINPIDLAAISTAIHN